MRPFACLWVAITVSLTLSPSLLSAQERELAKWTTVGSLQTARVGHTATLLHDGRVLIVGGYGNSDELASAELYDPSHSSITITGDLHTARTDHTATLLSNGLVLVVGGQYHGKALASAELYDPVTGAWTNTGSLHLARVYHSATLLANGEVLVAGGSRLASPPVFAQGIPPDSALDIAELYDPASGKWTVTENLHVARYLHSATLLDNGQVLVTGGLGTEGMGDILASAELYNPTTKMWAATASLPHPLIVQTVTVLPDGKVLMTGGKTALLPQNKDTSSAELYNPTNATWTPATGLNTAINGHSATLLPDGHVMVVGGTADPEMWPNTGLYDPSTGTWELKDGLNKNRFLHTATLLSDGRVFVTGGLYASGSPAFALASCEVYGVVPPPVPANPPPNTTIAASHPHCSRSPNLPALLGGLIAFTICVLIITACAVILLAAWLVFVLVRRLVK